MGIVTGRVVARRHRDGLCGALVRGTGDVRAGHVEPQQGSCEEQGCDAREFHGSQSRPPEVSTEGKL